MTIPSTQQEGDPRVSGDNNTNQQEDIQIQNQEPVSAPQKRYSRLEPLGTSEPKSRLLSREEISLFEQPQPKSWASWLASGVSSLKEKVVYGATHPHLVVRDNLFTPVKNGLVYTATHPVEVIPKWAFAIISSMPNAFYAMLAPRGKTAKKLSDRAKEVGGTAAWREWWDEMSTFTRFRSISNALSSWDINNLVTADYTPAAVRNLIHDMKTKANTKLGKAGKGATIFFAIITAFASGFMAYEAGAWLIGFTIMLTTSLISLGMGLSTWGQYFFTRYGGVKRATARLIDSDTKFQVKLKNDLRRVKTVHQKELSSTIIKKITHPYTQAVKFHKDHLLTMEEKLEQEKKQLKTLQKQAKIELMTEQQRKLIDDTKSNIDKIKQLIQFHRNQIEKFTPLNDQEVVFTILADLLKEIQEQPEKYAYLETKSNSDYLMRLWNYAYASSVAFCVFFTFAQKFIDGAAEVEDAFSGTQEYLSLSNWLLIVTGIIPSMYSVALYFLNSFDITEMVIDEFPEHPLMTTAVLLENGFGCGSMQTVAMGIEERPKAAVHFIVSKLGKVYPIENAVGAFNVNTPSVMKSKIPINKEDPEYLDIIKWLRNEKFADPNNYKGLREVYGEGFVRVTLFGRIRNNLSRCCPSLQSEQDEKTKLLDKHDRINYSV